MVRMNDLVLWSPISAEEVMICINGLKLDSAPEKDETKTKNMKAISSQVSQVLAKLVKDALCCHFPRNIVEAKKE